MTLGKSGAAGAFGCAWEGHNFEENYAVDSLQKQRRVIADTIHDCNPDARRQSIFRDRARLRAHVVEQGGNLRQGCSSMLRDTTAATHRQQP
jgi:hypothetical protein